ncbi:MAG: helix-turn-helix domain-containing protein [Nitrospiraceae bacterium]|nr:helix-turn-helix domain-containing protein [Nitrospiraceae bacterium]MDA8262454.1 helix-turn-helix domain-containing protein [Actinomycetota bacterium]
MARKTERETFDFAIAKTLEMVGDWWTLLIIRDALLGVKRFDEFHSHLGIARNILSARMKRLIDAGIMEKRLYVERPARFEYILTPKGKDIFTILVAIREWGERWYYGDHDLPTRVSHVGCGGETDTEVRCKSCGEVISSMADLEIQFQPGGDRSEWSFWQARLKDSAGPY